MYHAVIFLIYKVEIYLTVLSYLSYTLTEVHTTYLFLSTSY